MDYGSFTSLSNVDFNMFRIIPLAQSWEEGASYSYLTEPRYDHGLFLLTDCSAVYDLPDGGSFRAEAEDILFLPKGCRYRVHFHPGKGKTAHPFLLKFLLSDAQGQELLFPPVITKLCRDDGTVAPRFSVITQLYKSASTPILKAKVYELLSAVFAMSGQDECCIRYIDEHYTDNLNIGALAKRCSVSETAYRRRFRQLTGMSPLKYINKLKLEKACQLLRSGEVSTADICAFLNIYDLSYFYKIFRAHTGMTPQQYRQLR